MKDEVRRLSRWLVVSNLLASVAVVTAAFSLASQSSQRELWIGNSQVKRNEVAVGPNKLDGDGVTVWGEDGTSNAVLHTTSGGPFMAVSSKGDGISIAVDPRKRMATFTVYSRDLETQLRVDVDSGAVSLARNTTPKDPTREVVTELLPRIR